MSRNRVSELDIVKGIAIILVVIGHTCVPGNNFIYLFHMAVFFITSGNLYSRKNSESFHAVFKFIIRKFRSLWFPYFVGITFFTLLHNTFLRVNMLTEDLQIAQYVAPQYVSIKHYLDIKEVLINIGKAFLFSGGEQFAGTFWFFKTLFITSIMFCCVEFILYHLIKKENVYLVIQCCLSTLLFCGGRFLFRRNISLFGFARSFTVYPLFYLGYLVKRKIELRERTYYILAVLSLGILLICNNFMSVALDLNDCGNDFLFIIVSLSGWFLLYGISKRIVGIGCGKALQNIGKHSMAIMIGHFISFKIISLLGIFMNNLPYFCLAAFPVLFDEGGWWFFYAVVGVVIPFLVQELWRRGLEYIKAYNYL